MTFLTSISQDVNNVLNYFDKFENAIETSKEFFELEGKKLEVICRELPKKVAELRQLSIQAKSLSEYIEFKKEEVEGELWKYYSEGYQKTLSSKDIQMYIKQHPKYIEKKELILEIDYIKNQFSSLIEALDIMHWQMSNIVKLRIASLEQEVL